MLENVSSTRKLLIDNVHLVSLDVMDLESSLRLMLESFELMIL